MRVPGDRFVLFLLPSPTGQPRLGITATRKVGCSVIRNRARRQVREVFRHHHTAFDAWDIVVNVRQKAVGAPSSVVEAELLKLAARARRMAARGAERV